MNQTTPLQMLYAEWLRQGPTFPIMEHLCRHFSHTYELESVDYYEFKEHALVQHNSFPIAPASDTQTVQALTHECMPQNKWYTLSSDRSNHYYLGVYDNNVLIGLYRAVTEQPETLQKSSVQEWLLAVLHVQYHSRWQINDDWKFARTSSERWMIANGTGVEWFNPILAPWFRTTDHLGEWPEWVHEDAVIRNAIFWEQLESRNHWTGLVMSSAAHLATWWHIQKLEPGKYLIRVNTYNELTTNLLAQSHWQRHDPLTALPREMQMRWQWNGSGDDAWSIALVTVDHFYKLNKTYGAENVDKGLLEMAARLREMLPSTWSLWRGRAEQFYAMGPNADKEWFLGVLRMHIPECPLSEITASVGIGTDSEFLQAKKLAQEAVEQAISKGGRQLVINSYAKRIRCQSAVKESMEKINVSKDLSLVYDPIYKNSVTGFRLHTNWTHPVWGIINGDEFLPCCQPQIRQDYVHWVAQQLANKALEWKKLGLEDTKVLWPLPANIWSDADVQAILNKGMPDITRIIEVEEKDALEHFETLVEHYSLWKTKGWGLAISFAHSDDINILKLLQLQPDYVSLPWPFARDSGLHKAITEVISFILNRGIKVIAYCPHGVGAPQLFSGVIQQKSYH